MAKRSKVELFEEIRKAAAGKDSPSVRELSRTFGSIGGWCARRWIRRCRHPGR